MKKVLSLVLAFVLVFSLVTIVAAEEEIVFKNAICTVKTVDGEYLAPSGGDRGNALTVAKDAYSWRLKEFIGEKYSLIGENEFAADVNSASTNEGVTIIQWTASGAGNQKWIFEEAEDGLYYIQSAFSSLYLTNTEGVITQEVKSEELNQLFEIEITGYFEPLVEKMLESEAAKSLSEYRYERLFAFLMSGGEFNMLTYDKVEKLIVERDYFNLTYDEQKAFVEECFTIVPTDLMYGSMATKLQRDIEAKFIGIEENVWQSWHGIPEEAARRYDVTITDRETGDSHTFKYYSTLDNDEEYAKTVGEAVACFEMPIIKTLHRFIYTSMNTSSWNGGDNTIWNNTAYRGDVNNMVQMFAHELGHVMDNGRQDNDVWYRAIAQDMVPVTGYGNTNRWEDLAEFCRLYLLARGDEDRISAIENTYPARTRALKGLLYRVDNEFYADYKDECEAVEAVADEITRSQVVSISFNGKLLTDEGGVLTLTEKKPSAKNWQLWEVYSLDNRWGTFRNKATGKYLCVEDGKLTLGDTATKIGFKKGEESFKLLDSTTGFAIDGEFGVSSEEEGWSFVSEGNIPYSGEKSVTLHVTGEKLGFVDGEGLVLGEEGNVWEFVPVDKDYFLIRDKATGKVFDISGNSVLSGASAILYSVTGGTNQHFKLVNNSDGSYKLQLRHSGLYLTAVKTEEGYSFCQGTQETGFTNWVLQ